MTDSAPAPARTPVGALLRRWAPKLYLTLLEHKRTLRLAWRVMRASGDPGLAVSACALRDLSRRQLGWATTHPTRWWEYPWVIREVRRRGPGHGAAADFGAGKSPVPLALARLGYRTTVADPATLNDVGNEWDFTDYGRWGIETHKAGMEEPIFPAGALNVAVSVSVIEHIPADTRRVALAELSRALRAGGLAVLTIDVLPRSRDLWNRILDEIEPLDAHGTVDDLLGEADHVGLRLVHEVRCPIPADDHDVTGLILERRLQSPTVRDATGTRGRVGARPTRGRTH